MVIRADFHMHSCLSPCGMLEMSPNAMAATLTARGVQLAALTDHNTALNTPTFEKACRKAGIAPLCGIEAQTAEECHVLCLFSTSAEALALGSFLYDRLPIVLNRPEKTGDQVYVDENDDILGEVDKFLITSADITLNDLASEVHHRGGLVIPAHVDRPSFSLFSQLGFVPDGDWDALEVVTFPPTLATGSYPLITSSDSHCLMHIARRPFDLDIAEDRLLNDDGSVCMETIRAALLRRPVGQIR